MKGDICKKKNCCTFSNPQNLFRRNDKVIIFSDVVFALKAYAEILKR